MTSRARCSSGRSGDSIARRMCAGAPGRHDVGILRDHVCGRKGKCAEERNFSSYSHWYFPHQKSTRTPIHAARGAPGDRKVRIVEVVAEHVVGLAEHAERLVFLVEHVVDVRRKSCALAERGTRARTLSDRVAVELLDEVAFVAAEVGVPSSRAGPRRASVVASRAKRKPAFSSCSGISGKRSPPRPRSRRRRPRDCSGSRRRSPRGTSHRDTCSRNDQRSRSPASPSRVELEAVAARLADVVEEAFVRQRAGADEQDVVVVGRAEHAGVPASRRRAAADAGLERLRDDLLERRIGDERVRQPARIVLVGAGELDGRRRAVRFAVAGVESWTARTPTVSPIAGLKRSKSWSPFESSPSWSAESPRVRL